MPRVAPIVRRSLSALALLLCGAVLGVAGTLIFNAGRGARLEPWHELEPRSELRGWRALAKGR